MGCIMFSLTRVTPSDHSPLGLLANAATSGFGGLRAIWRCSMKTGKLMELQANLKALNLSTMARNMEG